MKKLPLVIFFICGSWMGFTQQSSQQAWEGLLNKKQLAEYFKGTFETLGIYVDDTQESFTVYHQGDHFDLSDGVDEKKVNYVVHLQRQNVENMKKHGEDSQIDEMESYRIMSTLFTPLTQSGLNQPIMNKKLVLRVSGVEEHIHVTLNSPDGKEKTSHTIVFVNGQWLLIPGLHGSPQRIFNMQPKDAVEYQRQLFKAQKENTKKSWKAFAKWYKTWKETVSVKA